MKTKNIPPSKSTEKVESIFVSGFLETLPKPGQDTRTRTRHPIRMGYALVVMEKKVQWVDEPKRRPNPFIHAELERAYEPSIRLDRDGREMVLIKRGPFLMGSFQGMDNEHPQRIVYMDDYYMDKYEVSNRDYYKYLVDSIQPTSGSWEGAIPPESEMDLAFAHASFEMAQNYCSWAGKDIATEEEWEKAARGTGLKKVKDYLGRLIYYEIPIPYPWGSKFEQKRCNCNGRYGGIMAVNSLPEGQSPYGVFHMAGNVMEWTKSWYKPYPGSAAYDRDFGEVFKVLRGGDFMSAIRDIRSTRRFPGGLPSLSEDKRAGIRCVYRVKATPEDGP